MKFNVCESISPIKIQTIGPISIIFGKTGNGFSVNQDLGVSEIPQLIWLYDIRSHNIRLCHKSLHLFLFLPYLVFEVVI
jgi:hypothetical protein